MQKYIPLAFEINLCPEGFVFDVDSLIEALCSLHDHRDARGIRYALVTLLVFMLLAKFAGESQLRGTAQWVKRRAALLADRAVRPQVCYGQTVQQAYQECGQPIAKPLRRHRAGRSFRPYHEDDTHRPLDTLSPPANRAKTKKLNIVVDGFNSPGVARRSFSPNRHNHPPRYGCSGCNLLCQG
jgi:hypothetical protein